MAKKSQKTIKVTLVRGTATLDKRQAKIVAALGFTKTHQTRVLPDNESIRGSIFKVNHVFKVEEEA
ncbi:MAG: 50S ribosomal protein L30 [Clostridia bacterium]|nr:50S ribosomal protein L30 [Clostridia bacterium]